MSDQQNGDEHPNPGPVGHAHQVAVHAGQDQATAERLAAAASLEGTEHRTGHTDREGYPVHAGQDQATAERLAEAASLEGTEHRTGHTDREGFPVHAGHAHVAGTDGPTDEDPDTDNAEADTKGHQD